MNITKAQYARIEKYFPVQRGNVKIDNCTFINAILYIAENGCKWRALPEKYGKWNSIYQRFKRWCENGVIQRIFNALQQEKIIAIKVEVLALDNTSCKLHPDAHGASGIGGGVPDKKTLVILAFPSSAASLLFRSRRGRRTVPIEPMPPPLFPACKDVMAGFGFWPG